MKRDIHLKWYYPHSQEVIWDCLTKPEILKEWWLTQEDFKAEVGYKWMDVRKPKPAMNWDGKMYFEILEVIPLKKLSYSFKGGPREGVYNLDTIVTWTLIPKDNGTELHLAHTGFSGAKNYFTSFIMEMGWKKGIAKRFQRALQKFFV